MWRKLPCLTLCAPSFLRPLLSLTFLAFACLLPAHAGTYTITYSGSGQSVSVGVQPGPYTPDGINTAPYSGTYGGSGSTGWSKPGNSVTCSGSITATATWQSSGPGDDPPASVVVKETGNATWGGTGIVVPTGSCSDGLGDSEVDVTTPPAHPGPPTSVSGVSSGVHYRVKSNPGMSFTLTPTASANVSCGSMTSGGGNASVSYTASIVNGNWDGPYYFHYGNYYGGQTGPWANNTAGSTPAITDVSDSNNLFSETDTTADECTVAGSITPVWFWNGPDLGQAPPSFLITVTTTAFARDYNQKSSSFTLNDGYGNTSQQTSPPDSFEVMDTKGDSVTVESDDYAPGEGNGWWALGPTVNLTAGMFDNEGNTPGSYNMYSSVLLTAAID